MNTKTKPSASEPQAGVHTSAPAAQAATKSVKREKPKHHQPTELPPPDEFHGQAGRFVRDPHTGLRRRADEDGQPAEQPID